MATHHLILRSHQLMSNIMNVHQILVVCTHLVRLDMVKLRLPNRLLVDLSNLVSTPNPLLPGHKAIPVIPPEATLDLMGLHTEAVQ